MSGVAKIWAALDGHRAGRGWADAQPDRGKRIEDIVAATWKPKEAAPPIATPHIGGPLAFWLLATRSRHHRDDCEQFGPLPGWARATLDAHDRNERTHLYGLYAFESSDTHDPLWNAAQAQLRREGRIHNYLRMLLEWTASPREALAVMIELNNKYALDGRDPNSCSGIFWVLGRYDRPWAPERPVYGTVRYMGSENTARKLRVRRYIARYS